MRIRMVVQNKMKPITQPESENPLESPRRLLGILI